MMNEQGLERRLASAVSRDDRLFNIWLEGKGGGEFVGTSGAACSDPVAYFIEEVIGVVAQPVVMRDSVFSRGITVPLCSQLQEVVSVSDNLGLEEITKLDLVQALRSWRADPAL